MMLIFLCFLLSLELAYRWLLAWKSRYLAGMTSELASLLEEAGLDYWIDWGTLLGALRAGQPLKHDTDVDVSVPQWEAERLRQLAGRVGERFRVRDRGTSLLFGRWPHPVLHTMRDDLLVHVEIVQEDTERNEIKVMPSRAPVDRGLVRPLGAIRLAGRTYPAPAQPWPYLEALYGYVGAVCVYEGRDRYRPCRTLGEHLSYHWNQQVFFRIYFLFKGLPVPRSWKTSLERRLKRLERLLPRAKT